MKGINVVSVQPGDILLFPAEMGFYQEIAQKFGKKVADIAYWLADSKYLHAEIVYDGNIVLAATGNGTYILERSMKELQKLTIMRHIRITPELQEQIKQKIREYWNLPYDVTSYVRNTVVYLGKRLGLEDLLEDWLDKLSPYDNKQAMICSEVVARIYEDVGLKIAKDRAEWVQPQDLRESPYLYVVYKSPYEK